MGLNRLAISNEKCIPAVYSILNLMVVLEMQVTAELPKTPTQTENICHQQTQPHKALQ